MKNKKGFTLIELLVVVLIIGILAAVALPYYKKAVVRAKISRILPTIKSLANAAEIYYLNNSYYPDVGSEIIDNGIISFKNRDTAHGYSCTSSGSGSTIPNPNISCSPTGSNYSDMPKIIYMLPYGTTKYARRLACECASRTQKCKDICLSMGCKEYPDWPNYYAFP
jgi:prepilin-type N-terminal cleavage/methylation domain-containing protein